MIMHLVFKIYQFFSLMPMYNKSKFFWSKLMKKGRLSALRNCCIHSTSKVEAGSHLVNSNLGKHSFCGYDCEIFYTDVGSYTSISNKVVIGGGMHPMEWVAMSPVFYEGRDSVKAKFSHHKRKPVERVSIGNDVWIGGQVLIKQGVRIGDGAVVGMGSVVTKDVDDYAIVAGNPAKLIRYRFERDVRDALLETKWWDLNEDALEKLSDKIKDPIAFIEEYLRHEN